MADNQMVTKVRPQTFSCPQCSASVTVRAVGQTLHVVCGSCGSLIDAANEKFQLLQAYAIQVQDAPKIALGKKGILQGILWQVLGYVKKCDASGDYTWDEYILFNPYWGYRFLVDNQGHWSFVATVRQHIAESTAFGQRAVILRDQRYDLFDSGSAKVIHVLGEFYWRISIGDTVETRDYIAPPRMLSKEHDRFEEVWSLGTYLTHDEVGRAFAIKDLPLPFDVGPHQPSPWSNVYRNAKVAGLIFVALIVCFQFFHILTASNERINAFKGNYTRDLGPDETLLTTLNDVIIKPGEKNIEIHIATTISNSWFELSGVIVDEDGNEIRDFEVGTEYYSGYDDEGSWSEGSPNAQVFLPSVPPGKYKILLSYSGLSDRPEGTSINVLVDFHKDVPIWQNFFIALCVLGGCLGFIALRTKKFESSRWKNSGLYAPDVDEED